MSVDKTSFDLTGRPDDRHSSTPQELADRLAAERQGDAYLLLRDGDGVQYLHPLARGVRCSLGRRDTNDVMLRWDPLVSRTHAAIEQIGGQWWLIDDGMSYNGTFHNGLRLHGRQRLDDGDVLRLGQTLVVFRDPGAADVSSTSVDHPTLGVEDLRPAQLAVLCALSRPLLDHGRLAGPASNQAIAEELVVSVDAVKSSLRVLFARFGLSDAPRATKRHRLAEIAIQSGLLNQAR